MFREMRRANKAITREAAAELLHKCEYGTLSTIGSDGYPYGVPLNYACRDDALYFHCATEGHKLDNIEKNSKVSFCVVGDAKVIPEKFSTRYESVIVFGRANIVTDDNEKRAALFALIEKYAPDYTESGKKYISNDFNKTKVVRIDIEHITGKKAKE